MSLVIQKRLLFANMIRSWEMLILQQKIDRVIPKHNNGIPYGYWKFAILTSNKYTSDRQPSSLRKRNTVSCDWITHLAVVVFVLNRYTARTKLCCVVVVVGSTVSSARTTVATVFTLLHFRREKKRVFRNVHCRARAAFFLECFRPKHVERFESFEVAVAGRNFWGENVVLCRLCWRHYVRSLWERHRSKVDV